MASVVMCVWDALVAVCQMINTVLNHIVGLFGVAPLELHGGHRYGTPSQRVNGAEL
jgi:hypothetical protein